MTLLVALAAWAQAVDPRWQLGATAGGVYAPAAGAGGALRLDGNYSFGPSLAAGPALGGQFYGAGPLPWAGAALGWEPSLGPGNFLVRLTGMALLAAVDPCDGEEELTALPAAEAGIGYSVPLGPVELGAGVTTGIADRLGPWLGAGVGITVPVLGRSGGPTAAKVDTRPLVPPPAPTCAAPLCSCPITACEETSTCSASLLGAEVQAALDAAEPLIARLRELDRQLSERDAKERALIAEIAELKSHPRTAAEQARLKQAKAEVETNAAKARSLAAQAENVVIDAERSNAITALREQYAASQERLAKTLGDVMFTRYQMDQVHKELTADGVAKLPELEAKLAEQMCAALPAVQAEMDALARLSDALNRLETSVSPWPTASAGPEDGNPDMDLGAKLEAVYSRQSHELAWRASILEVVLSFDCLELTITQRDVLRARYMRTAHAAVTLAEKAGESGKVFDRAASTPQSRTWNAIAGGVEGYAAGAQKIVDGLVSLVYQPYTTALEMAGDDVRIALHRSVAEAASRKVDEVVDSVVCMADRALDSETYATNESINAFYKDYGEGLLAVQMVIADFADLLSAVKGIRSMIDVGKLDNAAKRADAAASRLRKAGHLDAARQMNDAAGRLRKAADQVRNDVAVATEHRARLDKMAQSVESWSSFRQAYDELVTHSSAMDNQLAKRASPGTPDTPLKLDGETCPLDEAKNAEATATVVEKGGIPQQFLQRTIEYAQRANAYVLARFSNPASSQYMGQPGYRAKGVRTKAKTAPEGFPNEGLVVDPTHPSQAAAWDRYVGEAKDAETQTRRAEKRASAEKTWKKYWEGDGIAAHERMPRAETAPDGSFSPGHRVLDDGTVVWEEMVDGAIVQTRIHGDIDLIGIYRRTECGEIEFVASGDANYAGGVTNTQLDQFSEFVEGDVPSGQRLVQHPGADGTRKSAPHAMDANSFAVSPDGTVTTFDGDLAKMADFYSGEIGVRTPHPASEGMPASGPSAPSATESTHLGGGTVGTIAGEAVEDVEPLPDGVEDWEMDWEAYFE